MILLLTLLATALTTNNIQAANNNNVRILPGGEFPNLHALRSLSSSSNDSSRSASPSEISFDTENNKSVFDFWKEVKGRRAFIMQKEAKVFENMGPLRASTEAYTIKMYRKQKHLKPQPEFFPWTTDSFKSPQRGTTFSHLIQSYPDSDPSKKLCIYTKNDLPDHEALERFTKGMIASLGVGTQDAYFKQHKGEIGLPTGFENFDYNVYAWVSSVDCAFYNLGNPKYIVNPPGTEPTGYNRALTDVIGEATRSDSYSVQISRMRVQLPQNVPVTAIKVDRNSEMKITPFNLTYRTFSSLYKAFDGFEVEFVKIDETEATARTKATAASCNALFYDGRILDDADEEAIEVLQEALDAYRASGNYIQHVRATAFSDEQNYRELFSIFRETKSVTLLTWAQADNGECYFPAVKDSDDDSDFELENP